MNKIKLTITLLEYFFRFLDDNKYPHLDIKSFLDDLFALFDLYHLLKRFSNSYQFGSSDLLIQNFHLFVNSEYDRVQKKRGKLNER